jgi:hypothetical protein
MEDFRYKEYTEEESRIYHDAMDRIMEALQSGINFHDACGTAVVGDEDFGGATEPEITETAAEGRVERQAEYNRLSGAGAA